MARRELTPKQNRYDKEKVIPVICERIARGETLTAICEEEGMPTVATWCNWTLEDASAFEQYARARERRADARADRIDKYTQMMIAKEIDPQTCRVAIDAEKWQAGKEQPKRYGDKLALTGDDGGPLQIQVVRFSDQDKG